MSYETIEFKLEAGVARLTLNRPERLNAFNIRMHTEVADALSQIEENATTRVLLLTGAGRAFCAGQDLSERDVNAGPLDLGQSTGTYYNPLVRRLADLPLPVVCAVNGVAAGAGVNIALACDLVIARKSARFIQSFVNIGLVSDAGGTWILPRLVGQARALALAMTGDALDADTAAEWGLIFRSVPDEIFEQEVDALVAKFATAATRAVIAAKRAVRGAWATPLEDQLNLERDLQRELGFSEDYAEGVAAFGAKRSPRFRGR